MDENNPYIEETKETAQAILIVGLRNGYINDKSYSDAEISRIFSIEEEAIAEKISIALSLCSLESIEEISKDIYRKYNEENKKPSQKGREIRKNYNEKRKTSTSVK